MILVVILLVSSSSTSRRQNIVLVTLVKNPILAMRVGGISKIEKPNKLSQWGMFTPKRLNLGSLKEVVAKAMRIFEEARGSLALLAPSSPQMSVMGEWEYPKSKNRGGGAINWMSG